VAGHIVGLVRIKDISPGVWNKFIAKGIWALEEEHLAMIAPEITPMERLAIHTRGKVLLESV